MALYDKDVPKRQLTDSERGWADTFRGWHPPEKIYLFIDEKTGGGALVAAAFNRERPRARLHPSTLLNSAMKEMQPNDHFVGDRIRVEPCRIDGERLKITALPLSNAQTTYFMPLFDKGQIFTFNHRSPGSKSPIAFIGLDDRKSMLLDLRKLAQRERAVSARRQRLIAPLLPASDRVTVLLRDSDAPAGMLVMVHAKTPEKVRETLNHLQKHFPQRKGFSSNIAHQFSGTGSFPECGMLDVHDPDTQAKIAGLFFDPPLSDFIFNVGSTGQLTDDERQWIENVVRDVSEQARRHRG